VSKSIPANAASTSDAAHWQSIQRPTASETGLLLQKMPRLAKYIARPPGPSGEADSPSREKLRSARSAAWMVLLLVVYAIVRSILLANHEVSRDEVRAESIARAASDPIDLVRHGLVNEGHPGLWYVILWAGSQIWHDDHIVLKVCSFLVALGFVSVAVFAGPFPLFHRLLFAFGVFPLYYPSVICRSYGVAALLTLLITVEYVRQRQINPWRIRVYNALLAIPPSMAQSWPACLGVLSTSLTYRLWKCGWSKPSIFNDAPNRRLGGAWYRAA
jgi:hypothetical protein